MGRLVVLLTCALVACYTPGTKSCPAVDCPKDQVCDGQGGCAFPSQLAACDGQADGTSCTYTDVTGKTIDGACANHVCLPVGCGNGLITPPEVCDDGNTVNGDGCVDLPDGEVRRGQPRHGSRVRLSWRSAISTG